MSDNCTIHLPRKLPKGLTEERARELTVWVYKMWDIHWKEFAPTSNSRAQFQQYILRDHKELDEDQLKNIYNSIRQYTKHLRKLKSEGQKLIGIKTLSVWYNQECYNDQFIDDATRSAKPSLQLKPCSIQGCGQPVHGPMFDHCTDHIPNTKIDQLRDGYRDMVDRGVIAKGQNLKEQCRAIFAEKAKQIVGDVEKVDGPSNY